MYSKIFVNLLGCLTIKADAGIAKTIINEAPSVETNKEFHAADQFKYRDWSLIIAFTTQNTSVLMGKIIEIAMIEKQNAKAKVFNFPNLIAVLFLGAPEPV